MSETPARYTTQGGRKLPSVTEILREVLGDQWQRCEQWHLDRGVAAHALYAIMGRGEDVAAYDYDPRLASHVAHWQEWRDQIKPDFFAVEARVQYQEAYAGTLDALAAIDDKIWVIDYKQSSTPRDALQLAAYAMAWEADDPQAMPGLVPPRGVDGLMSVEIKESGWRVAGRWTGAATMAKLRGQWQTVLRCHGIRREYHRE